MCRSLTILNGNGLFNKLDKNSHCLKLCFPSPGNIGSRVFLKLEKLKKIKGNSRFQTIWSQCHWCCAATHYLWYIERGQQKAIWQLSNLIFLFFDSPVEKEEAWSGNGFPNVTKCEIAVATPGWWRCRWPLRETVIPRTRILRWIIIVIIIIRCLQEILSIWVK